MNAAGGQRHHQQLLLLPLLLFRRRRCCRLPGQQLRAASVLRTDESDPTRHAAQHVGSFYAPTPDDYDGVLSRFVRPELARLHSTLDDRSLLIRRPAVDIIACLRHVETSSSRGESPAPKFLLYGQRGSGKSLQMGHVATYCRRRRWLLLCVNSPHMWLRYSPDVNESAHRPGMFDLPSHGCDWLRQFYSLNEQLLLADGGQFAVSKELRWNAKETTPAGSGWKEVIDFALARPRYSCAAVQFLIDEILSGAVSCSTLLCFEAVNCLWWHRSGIKNEAVLRSPKRAEEPPWRADIAARQLTLFDAFKQLLEHGALRNGAVVMTTSQQGAVFGRLRHWQPKRLLGNEGFEFLDPFVPLHVGPYSEAEMSNAIGWYRDAGWLTGAAADTEAGLAELRFLSDGNPGELMRLAGEW